MKLSFNQSEILQKSSSGQRVHDKIDRKATSIEVEMIELEQYVTLIAIDVYMKCHT